MKVVKRALDLLALLRHFGEMPLKDISAALGVENNSAWNLLNCLCKLGHVEKSRNGVYRLGPEFHRLARGEGGGSGASLMAELTTLSTAVKESSVMVRLAGNQLEVVCDLEYKGEIVVRNQIYEREDALYCWACGHVLLAWSPDLIVKGIVAAKGLPTEKQWPGVQTSERLFAELDRIKATGIAERHTQGLVICSIAVPSLDAAGELFAIGIAYPGALDTLTHRKAIIANLKLTAERVARKGVVAK